MRPQFLKSEIQVGRIGGAAARAMFLFCAFGTVIAHAALWESPDWVLGGDAQARIAYESDITGSRQGVSDTLAELTPSMTLNRLHSLTQLEFHAEATVRRFFDHSDQNAVDSGLSVLYSYPNTDQDLYRQRVEAHFQRTNYADLDVGQRLRRTDSSGSWEGQLYNSGKGLLIGTASFSQFSYNRFPAADRTGNLGLFVGYDPRSLLEYSGGFSYVSDRYDPGAGRPVIERSGFGIGGRVRGELSAKIKGDVSIGLTRSSFSNTALDSTTDWTTQGDLDWEESARRHVRATIGRSTYFSPDGQPSVSTSLSLRLVQSIAGGYAVEIRTRAASVSRKQAGDFDYSILGGGFSLRYDLTGKVTAQLGADYQRRGSGVADGDFNWYETFLNCGYRF